HGQLTFDAEGREGGAFHSRKLHQPTTASGVTIGRGYDMKMRTSAEVAADLAASGVDELRAGQYARGAGLEGKSAAEFVQKTRLAEITPEQQKRLFASTFAAMEKDVKRIVSSAEVVNAFGITDWEKLNPAIKD